MGASHEVDVERRLVICRAWGVFSSQELIDHYRSIAIDPLFDPAFSQLGDLRDVEQFDMDTEIVRRSALQPVFSTRSQRALVARTDVGYGLARIYGAHAEFIDQNVRVFREMTDAEEWLGLSEARRVT